MFRKSILLALVLLCLPSFAMAEIGRIKRTHGEAFVERARRLLPAKSGMTLEKRDILVTGGDGRITVAFVDNSRFSTGPDSRINLEKFSYNPTTETGEFDVLIEKGTVAIVSGKIAHHQLDAMRVKTPTSILGVRGTKFIVQVQPALVLLPSEKPQGEQKEQTPPKKSALAVFDAKGKERSVVTGDYATAKLGSESDYEATARADEVLAEHGELIKDIPPPPSTYTLYFPSGELKLTEDSEQRIKEVFADIDGRPGAEVQVTGHTDTLGGKIDNDRLSLQRAWQIRQLLIDRGLDGSRIKAVGRGERELLVETPDATDEPRNRRVEIIVR